MLASLVLLVSALQLAYGQTADAPASDQNLSNPNQIVTVTVQDHTVSGLVTHLR